MAKKNGDALREALTVAENAGASITPPVTDLGIEGWSALLAGTPDNDPAGKYTLAAFHKGNGKEPEFITQGTTLEEAAAALVKKVRLIERRTCLKRLAVIQGQVKPTAKTFDRFRQLVERLSKTFFSSGTDGKSLVHVELTDLTACEKPHYQPVPKIAAVEEDDLDAIDRVVEICTFNLIQSLEEAKQAWRMRQFYKGKQQERESLARRRYKEGWKEDAVVEDQDKVRWTLATNPMVTMGRRPRVYAMVYSGQTSRMIELNQVNGWTILEGPSP